MKKIFSSKLFKIVCVIALVIVTVLAVYSAYMLNWAAGVIAEGLPNDYAVDAGIFATPSDPKLVNDDSKAVLLSGITEDGERKNPVELREAPEQFRQRILAIEDRGFYSHSGVSFRGIARAFKVYVWDRKRLEGASTLDQQLLRNHKEYEIGREVTLERKLREFFLAIMLDYKCTKDQIFEMYINKVNLGQTPRGAIIGFSEAARYYFGKPLKDLSDKEQAYLVGMLRGSGMYNPCKKDPSNIRRRSNDVIDVWLKEGKISPQAAQVAKQTELTPVCGTTPASSGFPYVTVPIEAELRRSGIENLGELKVYSTVDLSLQAAMQKAVATKLPLIEKALKQHGKPSTKLEVAAIAMDAKTGAVYAMVGGRSYSVTNQSNRAIDGFAQIGSIAKPFVYASFFENKWGPDFTVLDVEPERDWGHNYHEQYAGMELTTRQLLYKSSNVGAVEIYEHAGGGNVKSMFERAGLKPGNADATLALGTIDSNVWAMASAFSAFPNGGVRVVPFCVRKVETEDGTLLQPQQPKNQPGSVKNAKLLRSQFGQLVEVKLFSPQTAFILTDFMKDVLKKGTGKNLAMPTGVDFAAKTGSSRDGWIAGFSSDLVCVVWVGNSDNSELGLTGGQSAGLIFAEFMRLAKTTRPHLFGEFVDPGGLDRYEIVAPNGDKFIELFPTGKSPRADMPQPVMAGDPNGGDSGIVDKIEDSADKVGDFLSKVIPGFGGDKKKESETRPRRYDPQNPPAPGRPSQRSQQSEDDVLGDRPVGKKGKVQQEE